MLHFHHKSCRKPWHVIYPVWHRTSCIWSHGLLGPTCSVAFSHQRACFISYAYTSVNAGKSSSYTRDILSSHDCRTNQNKQNNSPKIWVKIYLKHCSKKIKIPIFILSKIYRDQNKLMCILFIFYILYKNLVHRALTEV